MARPTPRPAAGRTPSRAVRDPRRNRPARRRHRPARSPSRSTRGPRLPGTVPVRPAVLGVPALHRLQPLQHDGDRCRGARHRRPGHVADPDRLLVLLQAHRDRRPDVFRRLRDQRPDVGADFVVATLAIVFGAVSLARDGRASGSRRGLAKLGVILGVVGLLLASSSFPWRSRRPTPPAAARTTTADREEASAPPSDHQVDDPSGTATTLRGSRPASSSTTLG